MLTVTVGIFLRFDCLQSSADLVNRTATDCTLEKDGGGNFEFFVSFD